MTVVTTKATYGMRHIFAIKVPLNVALKDFSLSYKLPYQFAIVNSLNAKCPPKLIKKTCEQTFFPNLTDNKHKIKRHFIM